MWYMYVCVYIYIYIYIERERERERDTKKCFSALKRKVILQFATIGYFAK